ncbi:MAG: hypothetical protein ABUL43_02660, partial [Hyphomicrobium sp.]
VLVNTQLPAETCVPHIHMLALPYDKPSGAETRTLIGHLSAALIRQSPSALSCIIRLRVGFWGQCA